MTRQEAIQQGSRFYDGAPCRYGHGTTRYVSTRSCPTCHADARKRWNENNVERRREHTRKSVRAWAKRHPERKRAQVIRWRTNNPEKEAADVGRRNARRRGATILASVRETLPFYAEARRLTRETGIPHEVDHIIPLAKGGPHAPWNLMVLTEAENRSKGDGYFI